MCFRKHLLHLSSATYSTTLVHAKSFLGVPRWNLLLLHPCLFYPQMMEGAIHSLEKPLGSLRLAPTVSRLATSASQGVRSLGYERRATCSWGTAQLQDKATTLASGGQVQLCTTFDQVILNFLEDSWGQSRRKQWIVHPDFLWIMASYEDNWKHRWCGSTSKWN